MLRLDAPLDQQPQEAVELDLEHHLSGGLLGFWHAGTRFQPTPGIRNQIAWDTSTATAEYQSSPSGAAWLIKTSGTNIFATHPAKPTPTDAITVAISGRVSPVAFWSEAAGDTGFASWDLGGGSYVLRFRASGQGTYTTLNYPMAGGTDCLIAFTYDGAFLRVFRDGREIASTACTGTIQYNNTAADVMLTLGQFGGSVGTPGYAAHGSMEWFGVWDRALSADQLQALTTAPYQMLRTPLSGARIPMPTAGGTTYTQALTAGVTLSSIISGRTSRTLSAATTTAGVLSERTSRTFAGSMTPAGAVVRSARRSLAASLTASSTVASLKLLARSLSASMTAAGVLSDRTSRTLSASSTPAAGVAKLTSRILSGSLTASAAVARRVARSLSAGLSASAGVADRTARRLSASLTPASSVLGTIGGAIASGLGMIAAALTWTARVTASLTGKPTVTASLTGKPTVTADLSHLTKD